MKNHQKKYFFVILMLGFTQIYCQNNKSIFQDTDIHNVNDSTIIGFATTTLFQKQPEGLLGNFISDAVKNEIEIQLRNRIDVVFISNTAIKGQIKKGDISIEMIKNLLPFDDTLSILAIPGNFLHQFLDKIAMKGGGSIAGVKIKIKNMRADNIFIGEDPLSENKIYTIAIIEKNAFGEEGFSFLKVFPHQNLPNTLTTLIIKYIKKITTEGHPVTSHFDQRISYD